MERGGGRDLCCFSPLSGWKEDEKKKTKEEGGGGGGFLIHSPIWSISVKKEEGEVEELSCRKTCFLSLSCFPLFCLALFFA